MVFMYDPVDKPLDIEGHEAHAARYATTALGRRVERSEMEAAAELGGRLADTERLPLPTAGRGAARTVAPVGGVLTARHPVSGRAVEVPCGSLDEAGVVQVVADIVSGLEFPRQRFLALWRLLPERLDESFSGGWMARLLRVPDHSLIDHADATAGIWASRQGDDGGACLSFAFGPVQPFKEPGSRLGKCLDRAGDPASGKSGLPKVWERMRAALLKERIKRANGRLGSLVRAWWATQ